MMVLFSILLSLLLTLFTHIEKTSESLKRHLKLQSYCDHRVLEISKIAGEGLSLLAQLNPYALKTILTRRHVDILIAAASAQPELLPPLLRQRSLLMKIQKQVELRQRKIRKLTNKRMEFLVTRPLSSPIRSGSFITLEHGTEKLHVTKEVGFQSEIGAPLTFDTDFQTQQKVLGVINAEDFYKKNLVIKCQAQIFAKSLGSAWEARLVL